MRDGLALLLCVGLVAGCRPGLDEVVVYTSQDQVYAEPVLKRFEHESGVRVRAVYDSEAVKTVGLANRLLAERRHAQCDLFWSNEEMRARHLVRAGVFRDENGWVTVGYRSRRLVVNTNLVGLGVVPSSLLQLTNGVWSNKVVLAYPLFGTTAAHFAALRQHWGEAVWKEWCEGLVRNRALIVDGNSVVVKFVGRGERVIGLTDWDDIRAGQREGLPVAAAALSAEMLLISNTIGVVRGAPHPQGAEKLFEFLRRRGTLEELVAVQALEGVDRGEVRTATLSIDWERLGLEETTAELKAKFLR